MNMKIMKLYRTVQICTVWIVFQESGWRVLDWLPFGACSRWCTSKAWAGVGTVAINQCTQQSRHWGSELLGFYDFVWVSMGFWF